MSLDVYRAVMPLFRAFDIPSLVGHFKVEGARMYLEQPLSFDPVHEVRKRR